MLYVFLTEQFCNRSPVLNIDNVLGSYLFNNSTRKNNFRKLVLVLESRAQIQYLVVVLITKVLSRTKCTKYLGDGIRPLFLKPDIYITRYEIYIDFLQAITRLPHRVISQRKVKTTSTNLPVPRTPTVHLQENLSPTTGSQLGNLRHLWGRLPMQGDELRTEPA